MLTQELSRYKERYWGSSPPRWPHIPHQQHHNQHQVIGGHCAMGKLDYDLFLQNLDIQVGDCFHLPRGLHRNDASSGGGLGYH
jgi:hypothetical protein